MAGIKETTFKKNFDYILNLVGLMIGFSNVWRFPYVCYKNGGGAFIVAYLFFIVVLVYPISIFESALGQYTGLSNIKIWYIIPLFKGLGYAAPIMAVYWNTYLPVLMSWAVRWLGATFTSDPVWMRCDNEWNSGDCISILEGNASEKQPLNGSVVYKSSVEEFFNNHLLSKSDGLENFGAIKPDLVLCLAIVWVLAYFSVWKGIQWTSRVVYFTATVPLIMLVVLAVRGATLEGAGIGITEYLKPNVTKLGKMEVWGEAASQVLFSLGSCTGGIPTLSKFNKYRHNFARDMLIMIVANACASFVAGFSCFSILGHLALIKNVSIADVAEKGPGLVYVVYPTAMSLLPLYQLWCPLFFIMMLLIGFDSLFVYHEIFVCCLCDQFPQWFKFKYANEVWTGATMFALFLFGLTMVTPGGIYVIEILSMYAMTGWALYYIALVEMIAIGWAYGADNFCTLIEDMIKIKLGKARMLLIILWKYIGPAFSVLLIIYSMTMYRTLKYESYEYPTWANVMGWMIALSSSLTFPVGVVWVLYKAKGQTFKEKFKASLEKQNMRRALDEKDTDASEKMLMA